MQFPLVYFESLSIDTSYKIISRTRLKACLNTTVQVGRLIATIYPFADKKFLRLAMDMMILFYAYDDPMDDDALRLDETTATKFTNAIISATTDLDNFSPEPDFPIITAYHEYVSIQKFIERELSANVRFSRFA